MARTTENKIPEGMVVFNYARSKAKLPAANDVPTLNEKAFAMLSEGDGAPFFRIEAIDYPANGKGGIYEKSFFQSFLNVMKDRPIPGSKRGHEWISRPNSDFYTVGGELMPNEDGKTGTAFLKIYIPPKGDTTDNAGFIRDARAGIVHFSIVTSPEYIVKTEKDEAGNSVQVWHFISSKGAERNDAQEYGAGAMAQVVNSNGLPLDFDAAKALIESGHFDRESKINGEAVQNGIVYRSALRVMLSRANEEERPALAQLISMIDKSKSNGRKSVEKEEAIQLLATLIANGKEKIVDIAGGLGFADRLRNDADAQNAETVKVLNAKLGEKPLERIDAILAENSAGQEAARENAIVTLVGPAKNADGKPNVRFEHMKSKTTGLSGAKLTNALEELKKDPVMLALNAQAADVNSPLNRVAPKASGQAQDPGDGIPTITIGGK
jgi:hypothetical protein